MATYSFDVTGAPRPQGSMRALTNPHTGKAVVVHSKPKGLGEWRSDIKAAATGVPLAEGGVSIQASFRIDRPASVSPKKRPYPTVAPDIDKLARALLDALSGVAYRDDAQVVELAVRKRYCEPGEAPGVLVIVNLLEPTR